MDELVNDHTKARRTTGELVAARERYVQGDDTAVDLILDKVTFLVEMYPGHIELEDRHFFLPVMDYFTDV